MFSGKIYTADKNFTRPPVATVATNSKSGDNCILYMYLYIWMTTLNLGMILYTCYFICSDIFIYISINTKYKCWWLVRFEDVYKFIRGHRLSLGGSPRSPPFYFPIFIEPMNCFPRSQSQIFLEYSEHIYVSQYFTIFPIFIKPMNCFSTSESQILLNI